RADTIAFHFYTKLFYVINQARATEGPSPNAKSDKWFNLESPDSELLPKEARDAFKSISSLIPSPGIEPFEVQVLLSVPELANNQVLVYEAPDSSRVRVEPTPRFVLLESWKLDFDPTDVSNSGIAAATTYKHGIVLFRSLFSLLRLLPTWK
ncbi:phosphorylated protein that interacts with Vac8p, partial [Panaeolus papilionaceus]